MKNNLPLIKSEAKKMGAKIKELLPERGYYLICYKGKEIPVCIKFRISGNPLTGAEETKYKDVTYHLLKKQRIPTPKTVSFYRKNKETKKSMEKRLSTLAYPIIIKDAEGSQSKGIFPGIKDRNQAVRIIQENIKSIPRLVAQPMVPGNEYRVTVLGEKVIGALQMIPPRIIGDGKNNVEFLIKKMQKRTKSRTLFDDSLKNILFEQGLSIGSVPKKGEIVNIRKNSCLAEGGETRDVTEKVHREIVKYCVRATKATGKKLAGLDVMCEEISKDPKKQKFTIIEVNGRPDIYIHHAPDHGQPRNVVKEIINYLAK